jgi:hypothetical protein
VNPPPLRDDARRARLALLPMAAAVLGLAACTPDLFDVNVDLSPHSFAADFGPPSGTIPAVPCDVSGENTCASQPAVAASTTATDADVDVSLACDGATSRCFAAARARVAYPLDVLQDDAFVTKVERRAISVVRVVDLAYTLPVNTLTFDVPRIDVYVGPAGTRTETDSGAVLVDSIDAVAAGVPLTEPRHLVLADDSPARDLIQASIQQQQTFVFVVVASPRLEAGAPVPAGAFEVDLFPKLTLGFR